jgi:hypothetical protein
MVFLTRRNLARLTPCMLRWGPQKGTSQSTSEVSYFDVVYFDVVYFDAVYFDAVYFDAVYFEVVYFGVVVGRLPRLEAASRCWEPGRSSLCDLFARCAGVHVDFHAHRHLDNLRSFPSHSGLP